LTTLFQYERLEMGFLFNHFNLTRKGEKGNMAKKGKKGATQVGVGDVEQSQVADDQLFGFPSSNLGNCLWCKALVLCSHGEYNPHSRSQTEMFPHGHVCSESCASFETNRRHPGWQEARRGHATRSWQSFGDELGAANP
jgi:hypothetical protein